MGEPATNTVRRPDKIVDASLKRYPLNPETVEGILLRLNPKTMPENEIAFIESLDPKRMYLILEELNNGLVLGKKSGADIRAAYAIVNISEHLSEVPKDLYPIYEKARQDTRTYRQLKDASIVTLLELMPIFMGQEAAQDLVIAEAKKHENDPTITEAQKKARQTQLLNEAITGYAYVDIEEFERAAIMLHKAQNTKNHNKGKVQAPPPAPKQKEEPKKADPKKEDKDKEIKDFGDLPGIQEASEEFAATINSALTSSSVPLSKSSSSGNNRNTIKVA